MTTPRAYYNEIDAFAAQWLRNLIAAGVIAPGDVDERDIRDVTPNDLKPYTQCHFFAGIGVWSYALRRGGWLDQRRVWTGSCPCQPFSTAGRGEGFADERHLWPHWHHLIRVCKPEVVFGEQVASKDGLAWLDLVQSDMEGTGYAFCAGDICAAGVGAPHIRQRLWLVADARHNVGATRPARSEQQPQAPIGEGLAGDSSSRGAGPTNGFWRDADWLFCRDGKWRPVEPGTFPLAHGVAGRMGRLRAYGNAIVAEEAQLWIEAFLDTERLRLIGHNGGPTFTEGAFG